MGGSVARIWKSMTQIIAHALARSNPGNRELLRLVSTVVGTRSNYLHIVFIIGTLLFDYNIASACAPDLVARLSEKLVAVTFSLMSDCV
jgi:hypothetical protein